MVRTVDNCIQNDKNGFELIHICAMRVVKEVPHPELKITIFHWNNRYLIKLEAGLLEQTYKIQEYDVSSDEEVIRILDNEFIIEVVKIFHDMNKCLNESLSRLEGL